MGSTKKAPVKKECKAAVKPVAEKVLKVQPLIGGGVYATPEQLYLKLNEVIDALNK